MNIDRPRRLALPDRRDPRVRREGGPRLCVDGIEQAGLAIPVIDDRQEHAVEVKLHTTVSASNLPVGGKGAASVGAAGRCAASGDISVFSGRAIGIGV